MADAQVWATFCDPRCRPAARNTPGAQQGITVAQLFSGPSREDAGERQRAEPAPGRETEVVGHSAPVEGLLKRPGSRVGNPTHLDARRSGRTAFLPRLRCENDQRRSELRHVLCKGQKKASTVIPIEPRESGRQKANLHGKLTPP